MTIGILDSQQNCLICDQLCKNRRSLGNHIVRSHKDIGDLQMYVLKYVINNITPKCKCGCGIETSWNKNHYRFNDYITGHNRSGFAKTPYRLTSEQRKKCTESLRKTYKLNGSDIKKKISNSLKATFGTPEMHVKLSLARKEIWKNENTKQKQSISQKIAWSGDAGSLRRKKVFTEEFSQKIGEANLRRQISRISKLEQDFFAHIITIIPDAIQSKWFNFNKKKWCADIWLPTHNIIIEFDGDYYHGLDRNENFTKTQIRNMQNDELKRQIIIEKKMSLLRISESSSYMNIRSFDDLFNISYLIIIDGIIMKS